MPTKPTKVMLNIRLNSKRGLEFVNFGGIRLIGRSNKRDTEIRAKQEAESKKLGRDHFRGKRIDATGVKRGDSGIPIFSWTPEGRQHISTRKVREDIETKLGYRIMDAHLMKKEGDKMYFLRVTFNGSTNGDFQPSDEFNLLLANALDRPYGHLHAFRNPDGSVTINSAHALEKKEEEKVLRIHADGSVRCE